jgi:MFS transporter, DHA3 family, macrolide efflux protein
MGSTGGLYSALLRRESFGTFLVAGALQYAAPPAVLVVLLFRIALAYPAADRETFGALALAFLGLSSTLPTLAAAFFAGSLADRHDRGRLMRAANLVSLLATAWLAVDLYFDPLRHLSIPGPAGFYLPLWVLLAYPGWAFMAASTTVFRPAYNTTVPRLVSTEELGRANGLLYSVAAAAVAVSTVAAGALLTFVSSTEAVAVPFLFFLATQVLLVRFPLDLRPTRSPSLPSLWSSVREGFAYLVLRRDLFQMTVVALVINFLVAVALVELALYVVSWLGLVSGIWYGAVVAAATAGAGVGLLGASHLPFEERAGWFIIGLVFLDGLSLLGLAVVRSIWEALPLVFAYGVWTGMITTMFLSTVQATVPDRVMGRVFAADEVGSYALVPVGQWIGGLLTLEVGVRDTYVFTGAAIALFGVVMLIAFRSLRRFGYRPRAPAPAASGAEPSGTGASGPAAS